MKGNDASSKNSVWVPRTLAALLILGAAAARVVYTVGIRRSTSRQTKPIIGIGRGISIGATTAKAPWSPGLFGSVVIS